MRKLLTLVVAALILAGSYFAAFGVPAALRALTGAEVAGAGATEGSGAPSPSRPAGGPGRGGATTVVLMPLERQPYEDVLRAVGSAEALRSAVVTAKASGEVTETNLAANRQVPAGEVLVQLDARTEMYNLEIAQTELAYARETVERYERLQAAGTSTVANVTLSEAKVTERLAEAKVGLAQIALDDRTIRAPIAGKLGLSDVEIGDLLPANSMVVTIDDAEALLVEFELPERSIAMLTKAQTVLASTPAFAGRSFEGEIVSFDSRIDSITRSVTVKARIDNPDGLLWPGMTFAVRIIHESDPLAVLPATAITWSRGGSNVWIEKDGLAEPLAATILFRRDDRVWIQADIATGTLVVTEGAQKLRTGARITAAEIRTPDTEQSAPDMDQNLPEIGQAEPEQPAAAGEAT